MPRGMHHRSGHQGVGSSKGSKLARCYSLCRQAARGQGQGQVPEGTAELDKKRAREREGESKLIRLCRSGELGLGDIRSAIYSFVDFLLWGRACGVCVVCVWCVCGGRGTIVTTWGVPATRRAQLDINGFQKILCTWGEEPSRYSGEALLWQHCLEGESDTA